MSLLWLCVGLALLEGPALADCFAEDLSSIETTAAAGEWKRAQRLSHRLDRRVIFKAEKYPETCIRPAVARLAALRGIISAARGDLDRALWLWQGARALAADQLPSLDDFPEARELGVERAPAEEREPEGRLEWTKTRESTIPRLLNLTVGSGLKGQAEVTGYLSSEGLPIRVEYQATNALLAYIVIDLCSELPYPQGTTSASCSHSF